jgi:hypothetical protein
VWLTDLGALGAVTGALGEFRRSRPTLAGRIRAGFFGGLEPDTYQVGYVRGLWKGGAYAALEGGAGRRHVVGYVRINHGGLVERSVLTFSNFVPVKSKVFVYQVGEYDLAGPGGEGTGGLAYLFVNARLSAGPRIDLQGLFNRGRSVDARTITQDLLEGRAVAASALDGLLYESAGGRITVRIFSTVRVHAGYTQDQNNRDSARTRRVSYGASAQNVARSGLDITVTDSQIDRPTGSFHSVYASAGRQLGRVVYLSADYTSAASIVRYTRIDGLTVEMHPSTTQIGASATMNLSRVMSLFATAARTTDNDASDVRLFTGLTLRAR